MGLREQATASKLVGATNANENRSHSTMAPVFCFRKLSVAEPQLQSPWASEPGAVATGPMLN